MHAITSHSPKIVTFTRIQQTFQNSKDNKKNMLLSFVFILQNNFNDDNLETFCNCHAIRESICKIIKLFMSFLYHPKMYI